MNEEKLTREEARAQLNAFRAALVEWMTANKQKGMYCVSLVCMDHAEGSSLYMVSNADCAISRYMLKEGIEQIDSMGGVSVSLEPVQ